MSGNTGNHDWGKPSWTSLHSCDIDVTSFLCIRHQREQLSQLEINQSPIPLSPASNFFLWALNFLRCPPLFHPGETNRTPGPRVDTGQQTVLPDKHVNLLGSRPNLAKSDRRSDPMIIPLLEERRPPPGKMNGRPAASCNQEGTCSKQTLKPPSSAGWRWEELVCL